MNVSITGPDMDFDGISILRYAHAYASGGGMEQHLEDLDRTLLARHRMTVVRMFLGSPGSAPSREIAGSGLGTLVRISLPVSERRANTERSRRSDSGSAARTVIRDRILCSSAGWHLFMRRYVRRRPTPHRPGEPIGADTAAFDAIKEFDVRLAIVHHMGGSDSEGILSAARHCGVPCALQNHFSNARFNHLSVRKQVELASGVAGINSLGVPRYLRDRFQNLSNGIDTEFFRPDESPTGPSGVPQIFLPARIVREKGQLDLVAACRELRRTGTRFRLVIAGRPDSDLFLHELETAVARAGLADWVRLSGVLGKPELRAEYGRSTVVAFPTHHDEGLGRVVVEAQAMGVPVVAYDIGGVAEGVLPGRTGFLVGLGDIVGLAGRLRTLLENPEVSRRMGAAGREFVVHRFGLPALADRHEAFYRRLLVGIPSTPSARRAPVGQLGASTCLRS